MLRFPFRNFVKNAQNNHFQPPHPHSHCSIEIWGVQMEEKQTNKNKKTEHMKDKSFIWDNEVL